MKKIYKLAIAALAGIAFSGCGNMYYDLGPNGYYNGYYNAPAVVTVTPAPFVVVPAQQQIVVQQPTYRPARQRYYRY